jgi:hypothetical protein
MYGYSKQLISDRASNMHNYREPSELNSTKAGLGDEPTSR